MISTSSGRETCPVAFGNSKILAEMPVVSCFSDGCSTCLDACIFAWTLIRRLRAENCICFTGAVISWLYADFGIMLQMRRFFGTLQLLLYGCMALKALSMRELKKTQQNSDRGRYLYHRLSTTGAKWVAPMSSS